MTLVFGKPLLINQDEWKIQPFDFYMNRINGRGQGWKNEVISGINSLTLENAIADELNYVKVFGGCQQSNIPTPINPVDIVCNNGTLKVNSNGDIYIDGTDETVTDELGNTATAEMLLGVSGLRDNQEILSGNITRNIGVKILDGSENWQTFNTWFRADVLSDSLFNHLICTHFKNGIPTDDLTVSKNASSSYLNLHYEDMSSVDELKSFLATQYTNGTPVIVLYVLSAPTTETVQGQTLSIKEGTNVIEITNSNLNDLLLEASYKRRVS